MSLLQEVQLVRDAHDREKYDNLSELYAVINTIQCLQKAYIKDNVNLNDYTIACSRLITQYKSAFKQVQGAEFPTIESFLSKYKMDFPLALERIKEGRPIALKDDKMNMSKYIADYVSVSITLTDKLRLEIRSVDQIHPDLNALYDTMNRLSIIPPDFDGKTKFKSWLDRLDQLKASDELSADDSCQLLFDLDSSYNAFNSLLH